MQQPNIEITYLKKSKRLTIKVSAKKGVRVTAPLGLSKTIINDFINQKSAWILKKYNDVLLLNNETEPQIDYVNQQALLFNGKYLYLKINKGILNPCVENELLNVFVKDVLNKKQIKKQVVLFYQQEAVKKINERVLYYSNLLNVYPKSVSFKNYKARWGACSAKGHLVFNWQIIAFEPLLLDYVVAHELCHLIELNHSPRFYKLLEGLGFDKREIRLKFKSLKNLF